MKLNSPRKDPYSGLSRAEDRLRKQGYVKEFTVMDEDEVQTDDGKAFKPEDLRIDHIVRIKENKVFLGDENKVPEAKALYALQAQDGASGIITESIDREEREIIEAFLRQVDRHDDLQESYTS